MIRKKNFPEFIVYRHCADEQKTNFCAVSFNGVNCAATKFEESHPRDYFEIIWLKNGKGINKIDGIAHKALFLTNPEYCNRFKT